jgi:hypothetical protein
MIAPIARRYLLGTLAALLLLVALSAAAYAWNWQRYRSVLERVEPRLARLLGLDLAREQIEAALAAARSQIAPWLHPGEGDPETRLRQLVRQLADRSALATVSLQTVAARQGEAIPSVRITLTVTGAWPQVLDLLRALYDQRPLLLVESTLLMREGGTPEAAAQNVRLTVQILAPLAGGAS